MADINIGAIAEQLNYKVDLDMHNSQKPYIVETYDDGNGNGYRVWSDKWCEQYGYRNRTNDGTMTFIKEFDGNPKSVIIQNINLSSTTNIGWAYTTPVNITSTSFAINAGAHDFDTYWEAKGYIL